MLPTPQSELPAGLQVVRVRGGRAEVAAAGGHYTAQLTLVPSPRDDATLAKYRPPGEPDEAATGGRARVAGPGWRGARGRALSSWAGAGPLRPCQLCTAV